MICNGFKRAADSKRASGSTVDGNEFKLLYTNADVQRICKTPDVLDFVAQQQSKYLAHITRQPHTTLTKRLLFNDDKCKKPGKKTETLDEQVMTKLKTSPEEFYPLALNRKIDTLFPNLQRESLKKICKKPQVGTRQRQSKKTRKN